MVKITDRSGRVIECQDATEAIAMLQYLHNEDLKASDKTSVPFAELASFVLVGDKNQALYWNRENFWKFIDALGETQKLLLSHLVQHRKMSDEEMRKNVGVKTNLELGGILSGVSKQAGAHNIPARAVYTIENETQGGETKKSYVIAYDFLRIASEMNWPS
jgi:hypothetical protein